MKRLIIHLLLIGLGVIALSAVFIIEIDGTIGFLLTSVGVILIAVGLTWKTLVHFFLNII